MLVLVRCDSSFWWVLGPDETWNVKLSGEAHISGESVTRVAKEEPLILAKVATDDGCRCRMSVLLVLFCVVVPARVVRWLVDVDRCLTVGPPAIRYDDQPSSIFNDQPE